MVLVVMTSIFTGCNKPTKEELKFNVEVKEHRDEMANMYGEEWVKQVEKTVTIEEILIIGKKLPKSDPKALENMHKYMTKEELKKFKFYMDELMSAVELPESVERRKAIYASNPKLCQGCKAPLRFAQQYERWCNLDCYEVWEKMEKDYRQFRTDAMTEFGHDWFVDIEKKINIKMVHHVVYVHKHNTKAEAKAIITKEEQSELNKFGKLMKKRLLEMKK